MLNVADLLQGGAPISGVQLDLSSCVSRYGVAPAVSRLFGQLELMELFTRHPYQETELVEQAYAERFSIPVGEFTAIAGISFGLSLLALASKNIFIPAPFYTEYATRFPDSVESKPHWVISPDAISAALNVGKDVLISNPQNPSGAYISEEVLTAIAAGSCGRLIVDESYREFVDGSAGMMACGLDNVAVLRSVSKFHSLPGLRSGIVWSKSGDLRKLFSGVSNWPIAAGGASLTTASLHDSSHEDELRKLIHEDRRKLVDLIEDPFFVVGNPCANFVLISALEPTEIMAANQYLLKKGVRSRLLGNAHGLPAPALRITAPRQDEYIQFRKVISGFRYQ